MATINFLSNWKVINYSLTCFLVEFVMVYWCMLIINSKYFQTLGSPLGRLSENHQKRQCYFCQDPVYHSCHFKMWGYNHKTWQLCPCSRPQKIINVVKKQIVFCYTLNEISGKYQYADHPKMTKAIITTECVQQRVRFLAGDGEKKIFLIIPPSPSVPSSGSLGFSVSLAMSYRVLSFPNSKISFFHLECGSHKTGSRVPLNLVAWVLCMILSGKDLKLGQVLERRSLVTQVWKHVRGRRSAAGLPRVKS